MTRALAVVTGAGRGIGQAIAWQLARDGFRTAVVDRDADVAEETAAAIRGAGHEASGHALDVRDRAGAIALYEGLGRPEVLVNNAGIGSPFYMFEEISRERLAEMIGINVKGIFVMAQEAARRMVSGGRIVNIASRGYLGGAGASHYVASKTAVVGLTRAMAVELRWVGINVNAVAPGLVDTRMIKDMTPEMRQSLERREPSGRAANPAEIAAVVGFLASPAAAFVNGQVLLVDGGKSVGIPPL